MKDWPGIKSVIKVISVREIKDKKTAEHRFYLSSMPAASVKLSGDAVRSHWGVENGLHHLLDVTFGQDKSRIRNGNAPENFGIMRHLAMNILRGAPEAKKGSPSIKLKRRRAGMDLNYLKQIIKKAVTPDNSGI
jgi:predicted transposase YbfD/YdcC